MSWPGLTTIDRIAECEGDTLGGEQMKITEGLNIISTGWIRKPKGFRVRFHKPTETGFKVGYSPPLDDAPMASDVTARRYAWKLWQATQKEVEANSPEAIYNIVVVDDLDRPFPSYATGELERYNPNNFDGRNEKKAKKDDGTD